MLPQKDGSSCQIRFGVYLMCLEPRHVSSTVSEQKWALSEVQHATVYSIAINLFTEGAIVYLVISLSR